MTDLSPKVRAFAELIELEWQRQDGDTNAPFLTTEELAEEIDYSGNDVVSALSTKGGCWGRKEADPQEAIEAAVRAATYAARLVAQIGSLGEVYATEASAAATSSAVPSK